MKRTLYLLPLTLLFVFFSPKEDETKRSRNGWHLSPHGTIRLLVIYAEMDYDKTPGKDPLNGGDLDHWKKGQLPNWKADLFDPQLSKKPHGRVTRYFNDMSMGNFIVLGDYLDVMVTIKESELKSINSYASAARMARDLANEMGTFRTGSGLGISDFDMWTDGAKSGEKKINKPDDPHSFDHIMVIFRNHHQLKHGQGSVDPGSSGKLFGHGSDTQSRFGGLGGPPFDILKHEFNHLLFGGNNFHVGGGNGHNFYSYFIPLQGGWSMMGGASSSLLTCNAWDRQFLGWKGPGKELSISVMSSDGRDARPREINGDLDPMKGDTGIFVIRDFIPTSDALRIKLPYLPEDEFQQWFWIENHQTYAWNGCEFDRFHFEPGECIKAAVPGLYMYRQADKALIDGGKMYGGYADYLRPMPANGFYDMIPLNDTIEYSCIGGGRMPAYRLKWKNSNPLSGSQEMELPVCDSNGDGKIGDSEDFIPRVEKTSSTYTDNANFFGHTRHVYTLQGNKKIGMGTNPSTASMQTLVSAKRDKFKGGKPNNRVIYLNGISVEMLEAVAGGGYKIRVRNNDTRITENLRWCGDSIVLPKIDGYKGHSLYLDRGTYIMIDRSYTASRLDSAQKYGSKRLFNDPTSFTISEGASVLLEDNSSMRITNGSTVHVLPGAKLEMLDGSNLNVDKGGTLIVHPGAELIVNGSAKIRQKRGSVVYLE